jgi:hypothetical protein
LLVRKSLKVGRYFFLDLTGFCVLTDGGRFLSDMVFLWV